MNVLDLTDATKKSQDVVEQVELKVGEDLQLRLYDIPSSGYLWQLREISDNLLIKEDAYVSDRSSGSIEDPELVGGGGTQMFIISAQSPGAGQLTLSRLRPWDPDQVSGSCAIQIAITD